LNSKWVLNRVTGRTVNSTEFPMRMMIGHLEGKALCIKYAIHFDIRKHIKILTQSYSINMPDTPSLSILLDEKSMARIVRKILNKDTEQALSDLSSLYNIRPPEIVVGTIKGKRKTVYAVYVQNENRIYAMNSDIFYNPFVVLHEFYHHLRSRSGVHRGSEKNANMYAKRFIDAYSKVLINK
jgi:hypothetical protein